MREIKIGDFIIREYKGHKEVMMVEGSRSIATFWGPLGDGFVTEEQYQHFIQLFASAPDLQRERDEARASLDEVVEFATFLRRERDALQAEKCVRQAERDALLEAMREIYSLSRDGTPPLGPISKVWTYSRAQRLNSISRLAKPLISADEKAAAP